MHIPTTVPLGRPQVLPVSSGGVIVLCKFYNKLSFYLINHKARKDCFRKFINKCNPSIPACNSWNKRNLQSRVNCLTLHCAHLNIKFKSISLFNTSNLSFLSTCCAIKRFSLRNLSISSAYDLNNFPFLFMFSR